jgi:hypothetical protein
MTRKIMSLIVVLSAVVASASDAQAKQPNVGDIATCNKEAEAASRTPSALPAPGRAGATPALPPTSGSIGGSTDSTGQIITNPVDPLLEGMAAARATDPAFRTAYRDCMTRLGY